MSKISSPLRYPGGKACMLRLMTRVIVENDMLRCQYAEPYAGGCGLALSLLYDGVVPDIHINDIDPAIWSFWYSILNEKDKLINLISKVDISVSEWEKQKEIYEFNDIEDPVELGFSAFFLNRTNRSGIIKGAGMIGGKDQSGSYKMDCRFNKLDLIRKIERINGYKKRIKLYNLDALDFMDKQFPEMTFFALIPLM
jgi:DNA adenine methylase